MYNENASNKRNQNVLGMLRGCARALCMALLCTCFALGLCVPAKAQGHSASISWTNSKDTSSTNVYRLTGTCPTGTSGFTKISAAPVTTGTYTDLTIAAGNYCYYVTATLNGVESVPSNTIQATIPVAPPSGLTITTVSRVITGNTQTLLAKWIESDPSVEQHFFFSDGTNLLAQGITSSLTGIFAESYSGPTTNTLIFTVCDAAGACSSQKAM